eukprot:m.77719 g.77719  ORF g.77719 m.77719 type:complete len:105 (-) comp8551_c0_seq1:1699-2013(-)
MSEKKYSKQYRNTTLGLKFGEILDEYISNGELSDELVEYMYTVFDRTMFDELQKLKNKGTLGGDSKTYHNRNDDWKIEFNKCNVNFEKEELESNDLTIFSTKLS